MTWPKGVAPYWMNYGVFSCELTVSLLGSAHWIGFNYELAESEGYILLFSKIGRMSIAEKLIIIQSN